jgi:DNA-directed RNA polymerase subunit M/transcription elongation factor TFIIS
MKFCPVCDNMLIPKGQKLYCRICNKEYRLLSKEDYVFARTIDHDEEELSPIIIENPSEEDHISTEDREAYEDFFKTEGFA